MGLKGWRCQGGRGTGGRKGRRKPAGELTLRGLRERESRDHRELRGYGTGDEGAWEG